MKPSQSQRDSSLGARLADPAVRIAARVTKVAVSDADVTRLEALIDRFEAELPPLTRFILAGGAPAGAALHVARTVCRRAERRIVSLEPAADTLIVRYVNRLSDLLFVLARVVNRRAGVPEIGGRSIASEAAPALKTERVPCFRALVKSLIVSSSFRASTASKPSRQLLRYALTIEPHRPGR